MLLAVSSVAGSDQVKFLMKTQGSSVAVIGPSLSPQ